MAQYIVLTYLELLSADKDNNDRTSLHTGLSSVAYKELETHLFVDTCRISQKTQIKYVPNIFIQCSKTFLSLFQGTIIFVNTIFLLFFSFNFFF